MTVVPLNLREPLKKFKRLTGIAVLTVGVVVLLATLAWLVAWFASRAADLAVLRASFGTEFAYWVPVLVFFVPGLLLIFHGKRMMRDASVSLLGFVEVFGSLAMIVVVFFLAMA